MKICVVIPVLHSEELVAKAVDEYTRAAAPGTELTFVALDRGTYTIESEFDVVLNQPATLRAVQKAGAAGAQAVILACSGDPAGAAAKSACTGTSMSRRERSASVKPWSSTRAASTATGCYVACFSPWMRSAGSGHGSSSRDEMAAACRADRWRSRARRAIRDGCGK